MGSQSGIPKPGPREWALHRNHRKTLEMVKQGNSITFWGKLLCLVEKELEGSKRADRASLKGLLCSSGKR